MHFGNLLPGEETVVVETTTLVETLAPCAAETSASVLGVFSCSDSMIWNSSKLGVLLDPTCHFWALQDWISLRHVLFTLKFLGFELAINYQPQKPEEV